MVHRSFPRRPRPTDPALRRLLVIVMCVAAAGTSASAQNHVLLGPTNIWGIALNNLGQVAFQGDAGEGFLWTPFTPNGSTGSLTSLGTFLPSRLNDAGQILGMDSVTGAALLRDPVLGDIPIPVPGADVSFSFRWSLNNAGQVAGRTQIGGQLHVFVWSVAQGLTIVAGPTLPDPTFIEPDYGPWINDYGQILASRLISAIPPQRPFLWTPDAPNGVTGSWVDIPVPPEPPSVPFQIPYAGALSDYGSVVFGWDGLTNLWIPASPNAATGTSTVISDHWDVGSGEIVPPFGINDDGWVAWSDAVPGAIDDFVSLWVPNNPNGSTGSAIAIEPVQAPAPQSVRQMNNAGQLVGWETKDVPMVFLWSPQSGGSGSGDGDLIEGGPGDDVIDGKQGNDILIGGDGNDTLSGGSDDDSLRGGTGADLMNGDGGDDSLDGGDGDDTMDGGAGNDELSGGPGNDVIDGGSGCDTLFGGDGDDFLDCGPSDSQGNDVLDGGAGNDVLFGGQGNDILIGGPGDDFLCGRAGNDDITPGLGVDDVNGDSGADTIHVSVGDAPAGTTETIDGGSGSDTLVLTGFTPADVTGAAPDFTVTDPVTGAAYVVTAVENVTFL